MRFLTAAALVGLGLTAAAAQGLHHPFAVGANEGSIGPQSGFGAWLIGQESRFYLALTGAVRETKAGLAGAPKFLRGRLRWIRPEPELP